MTNQRALAWLNATGAAANMAVVALLPWRPFSWFNLFCVICGTAMSVILFASPPPEGEK